jgi:hypothetical protein
MKKLILVLTMFILSISLFSCIKKVNIKALDHDKIIYHTTLEEISRIGPRPFIKNYSFYYQIIIITSILSFEEKYNVPEVEHPNMESMNYYSSSNYKISLELHLDLNYFSSYWGSTPAICGVGNDIEVFKKNLYYIYKIIDNPLIKNVSVSATWVMSVTE